MNPKDEMFNKAHVLKGATPEVDQEFPDHEDYELEVWMSTDGKHTVRGKATTTEGKKLMYGAVVSIFEQIKGRYGTKQALNAAVYDKPAENVDPSTCKHARTKTLKVRKEGANQGKEFLTCLDCKKFVGFI